MEASSPAQSKNPNKAQRNNMDLLFYSAFALIAESFDGICILIAMCLFYGVRKGYRDIAFSLLCYFIVSDVFYHYFLLDFRKANNVIIYQFYSVIDVCVIIALSKLKAHLSIIFIIALNILLNIFVSFFFISPDAPQLIYKLWPYFAGTLAALTLIYMRTISYGTKFIDYDANSPNTIGRFFHLRYGDLHWGIFGESS